MANIFTLWSSGRNFTNEDGWSSTLGALSYRGALKGLCYRSEALDQRIVVTTSENKHLIRLKRRMFVVPETVLRTATSAVMQRIYRDIPSRLPPYHWDAGSIRILSLPRGIPHEWQAFFLISFLWIEVEICRHAAPVYGERNIVIHEPIYFIGRDRTQ